MALRIAGASGRLAAALGTLAGPAWGAPARVGAVLGMLAALAGAPAQAAGTYFGVAAGELRFHQAGSTTAETAAIEVKLGRRFSEHLGVELRYGTTTADDEVRRAGVPVNIDVERYYGVYALALYPLSYEVAFYGLAGVTRGEIGAAPGGLVPATSDVEASYGLGMEMQVGTASALTLEWVQLFDERDFKATVLTAGLSFRF